MRKQSTRGAVEENKNKHEGSTKKGQGNEQYRGGELSSGGGEVIGKKLAIQKETMCAHKGGGSAKTQDRRDMHSL